MTIHGASECYTPEQPITPRNISKTCRESVGHDIALVKEQKLRM